MESIQAKARYYNAQLDKELSKIPQLNQFQTQTGVPKTYVAIGGGSLVALLIFFNFAGKFLSNTIGFVYPAYRSFQALESAGHDDDRQWSVYGFLSILESFTDMLMYWFPFYFFLKTMFLLWLMIPTFNGATVIYTRVLRPFLAQHSSRIDHSLNNIRARVSSAAADMDANISH
ncbi:ER membrane protein DP1/Yop1 [Podila minutissima]|uniref:Protein YOP1 n=1 Tax=Podila minutissima TaxID=64525 RepID=A0A9P5VL79_9FUNG|nr:ER membrane protein DP1/Yop1 [Podila minutissima]